MKPRLGATLRMALLALTIIVATLGSNTSISGAVEGIEVIDIDSGVLTAFAQQGVAANDVVLSQDYAPRSSGTGRSPYVRVYRDALSDTRVMEVSALPMVKPTGEKIKVGWLGSGTRYTSDANLFLADVIGTAVTVTTLSDQPNGTKAGEAVTWNPRLYLGGVEALPGAGPTVLPVDPTNENYSRNVLEWDYGIAKRRLRIIEGRIRERWVFESDPGGEVRIKHNVSGTMKLKLGHSTTGAPNRPLNVAVIGDEEIVPASEFTDAVYPVYVGASPETFYPDADAETSSVDGQVGAASSDVTWATLMARTGDSHADDAETAIGNYMHASTVTDRWDDATRAIFLFDTSALPDDATVTAAVLSFYGHSKVDQLSATPDTQVYHSNPASNTGLADGDYETGGGKFEVNALSDTPITYANWNSGTPGAANNFTLNAAGRAEVSKTGVTKLGLRNAAYDVAVSPPNWVSDGISYCIQWTAEKGAGYKPTLVVTYTLPSGWTGTVNGVADPAEVLGVPVADIDSVMGVAGG